MKKATKLFLVWEALSQQNKFSHPPYVCLLSFGLSPCHVKIKVTILACRVVGFGCYQERFLLTC